MELPQKKKRKQEKPPKKKSSDPQPIRSVYVTGLPLDVTTDELKEIFTKCGIINEDPTTGESKIKIYKDIDGNPKGDALITYFKEESVDLAAQLLDDSYIRPSCQIHVQKAITSNRHAAILNSSIRLSSTIKRALRTKRPAGYWINGRCKTKSELWRKSLIGSIQKLMHRRNRKSIAAPRLSRTCSLLKNWRYKHSPTSSLCTIHITGKPYAPSGPERRSSLRR